jgi:hypothetical protein
MASQKTDNSDCYLTEDEAAAFTSFSPRTLQAWRQQNVGPPFIRVRRSIRYCRASLIAWMKAQTQQTASPSSGECHT